MAKYTKEQAVRIITECAKKYKEELLDRTLLFVCADKHKNIICFEFSFYSRNFMHLTGIKTKSHPSDSDTAEATQNISAADFYNKCLSHKLSPDDFEFSDDGTTHMKLDILPSVLCKNLAANMIGKYNSSKPRLYTEKIAGGVKACMGFVVDAVDGKYVPNTVLKEDIRNNVTDYLRVIEAYRRKTDDAAYKELTYRAKNIDWKGIKYPDEFSYLQSEKRQ